MTPNEGKIWLDNFMSLKLPEGRQVIICPPFTLLSLFSTSGLSLCAQNISAFPEGSYTGETSASMVKDLVSYTLIGHLERRKYFSENKDDVNNKISQAKLNGITPVLCISKEQDLKDSKEALVGFEKVFILYEPESAIGTGLADNPENAENFCLKTKNIFPSSRFLYGGSVSKDNISKFSTKKCIDGVIVGKNSLDPLHFFEIVQNG